MMVPDPYKEKNAYFYALYRFKMMDSIWMRLSPYSAMKNTEIIFNKPQGIEPIFQTEYTRKVRVNKASRKGSK